MVASTWNPSTHRGWGKRTAEFEAGVGCSLKMSITAFSFRNYSKTAFP